MTIDEYLGQLIDAKKRVMRLEEETTIAANRAQNVKSSLALGSGSRTPRSENISETNLIKFVDIKRKYKAANDLYFERRAQLENAIKNMLFWQGCIIQHVYIYNLSFGDFDIYKGAAEAIGSDDRREILAKLAEAKAALADLLRAQGVEIE